MISSGIDEFCLDWIRSDRKARLSAVHPEADAFQQICGNILSDPAFRQSSGFALNLVSFPTEGRDGAIDHYAFLDEKGTAIVECKKNNSVENCIIEIKKLQEKLSRNLNGRNAPFTIYSPWFNKKLNKYIFCTSCKPSNAAAYEKLNNAIGEMMQQLAAISSDLVHLSSIKVLVYTWSQLKEWLDRSAYLLHKWVQPGIEGIEYVSDETPYAEGYRSYLSSSKIPYIRRDDFILKHSGAKDLPSEQKYLDELIANTEKNYKGLIIYGEGGIGKTRLMREMALMSENLGWQAYKVNALVDFKELISFLKPGGKYILLFDYIEELPEFHEWTENLTQKERAFEVKIIANCRSSYISNVRVLASSRFIEMDISNSSASSRQYYYGVVNEIIQGIPALKRVSNKIFQYRPSFAVFVRYLYDRDKKYEFDLRQDEDFQAWIIRRLGLTFNKLSGIKPDKEVLAKIFSCLPTHEKGKEILENTYTAEINILIDDGWFENRNEYINREQKQLAVIHDSITDEVLLDQLQRNRHTIETVIRKFFDFAAKNYLIFGCSRAFERISDSPLLAGIDFASAFSRIIADYPEQMKESYYLLVKTSLVSEDDMIPLYFKHKDFFGPYIKSPSFAGPLSYLLNDIAKRKVSEQIRQQVSEVYNWWYQPNKESILSNLYASKIISTSIRFFGPHQREQKHLEDYLSNFSLLLEASFLIGAWLETGGEKAIVEKPLLDWLAQHEASLDARFVMSAWLEAGGDKSLVEKQLVSWLARYENMFESQFVCSSWLKAGGEKAVVEDHVINWLKRHNTTLEASFIIGAWLEVGGEKNIVEKHVVNWLDRYEISLEARFVIRAWLEAGGEKKDVERQMINWLDQHKTLPEASFVIGTWLKVKGDKAVIEQRMKNWLDQNERSVETSFVISAWLEAGGDKAVVAKQVSVWLGQYEKAFEAQFVYSSWLEAKGEKAVVEEHLSHWLEEYEKAFEAQFVYSSWLRANGEKELVEKHLENWLAEHGKTFEAQFVYTAWLEAEGDRSLVEKQLTGWLDQHETTTEGSFVIGSWLKAGGDLGIVERSAINWLNVHAGSPSASYIFQPWLKSGGKPAIIEKPFVLWLDRSQLNVNSYYSIGLWLRNGGSLNIVRFYVAEYIDKFSANPKADNLLDVWMSAGGEVPIRL